MSNNDPVRGVDKAFPDICEWYTEDRVAAEEQVWTEGQHYLGNARRIEELCDRYGLHTVVEAGCGTGWIPFVLDPAFSYIAGVDANPYMLARARLKNASRPPSTFLLQDLRDLSEVRNVLQADLVCCFAVLKHFSLRLWPQVLREVLSLGHYGLFTQHALPDDRPAMDIGTEWHNAWPNRREVTAAIAAAGHEILAWDDSCWNPSVNAPEVYFTTRRKR